MSRPSFPVGVVRYQDGNAETRPLAECPVCEYEDFDVNAQFPTAFGPEEAATVECPGCGSEFELRGVLVDSS